MRAPTAKATPERTAKSTAPRRRTRKNTPVAMVAPTTAKNATRIGPGGSAASPEAMVPRPAEKSVPQQEVRTSAFRERKNAAWSAASARISGARRSRSRYFSRTSG